MVRRRWWTRRVERQKLKARAGTSRAAGSFEARRADVTHGMRWVGLNAARRRVRREEKRDDDCDGLDQHRAQITAEWIGTETVRFADRVAPADGRR